MTHEQELIKRAVDAADKMPQTLTPEEYIAQSSEHAEWYAAFNALRKYIENIPA